ncbi:MAG: histidine kinase [Desulfobulbaceae bacterium]|nr:histidine kinase [Desulfobulbaceae bacterium]
MNFPTRISRLLAAPLILAVCLALSGGFAWVAVRNYRAAAPLAEENLRGLALTLSGAMEGLAARDPSLVGLDALLTPEVAYAALIGAEGTILFHSNHDLIGTPAADARYLPVLRSGAMQEGRIRLGTGETVYEYQAPLHRAGQLCVVRLALHTWRAEAVRRRAGQGMTAIFTLLAVGWALGGGIVWLLYRQAQRQRLAGQQQELARLGEVGAVLAHEVRNPLAGIKGYGQLLAERLPVGREHDFAGLIVSEAKRLEELVEDILLYTRSVSPGAAAVPAATVVAGVLALLAPQVEALKVRISCQLPPELTVLCPEEGLRRVLLNLLTNALQASPLQGQITLAGRKIGRFVELSVADQGAGIAPEMRAELFLPFRTDKPRGSGLGLAICRKIVEGCGGSIAAEAPPGGGALFRVRLPAA